MHDPTPLTELPTPAAIQQELGRVLRQATMLRRLFRLALAEQERQVKDNAPIERDCQSRDRAMETA